MVSLGNARQTVQSTTKERVNSQPEFNLPLVVDNVHFTFPCRTFAPVCVHVHAKVVFSLLPNMKTQQIIPHGAIG